jgi:hypothetical protein
MSEFSKKYLPERTVISCFELIKNNSVHFKIVSERQTRHGDYRRNTDGKHEIVKFKFKIPIF